MRLLKAIAAKPMLPSQVEPTANRLYLTWQQSMTKGIMSIGSLSSTELSKPKPQLIAPLAGRLQAGQCWWSYC